jgi:hypothetical protein
MSSGLSVLRRVLFSKKPALVPEGTKVEPLEAEVSFSKFDAERLAKYREVCGWKRDDVPLTWPHVMASQLHLGLLSSPRFPVRLLGLVHLANRIELRAPLHPTAPSTLVTRLAGMSETERGQEFELHTELRVGADVPWREVTTFLARKKKSGGAKAQGGPLRPAPERLVGFEAPSGLGRRYGRIAGDLNPIHLFDVTAKAFGFPRAIAHGMWSLARIAAELDTRAPCTLTCQFKLPLFLPSQPVLELSADGAFTLFDERREKPHVAGALSRG